MNAYSEGAFLSLLLSRIFSRTFLSSGAIGVPIFSAFSRILPNSDTISSHRQSTRLRQICRGRIVASREGYPVGCNGRHICRPYGVPVILQSPQIYPSSVTCGDSFPPRGSHTGGLPGRLALTQKSKEGSRPLPTNNREASSYRQSTRLRQVCRGRIVASRAVYPVVRNIRAAARAAYMPPLRSTRNFRYNIRSRAGQCPAPTGW